MFRRTIESEPANASTPLAALAHDVTPVAAHFVRTHGRVPDVTEGGEWRLAISGHVLEPYSLALREARHLLERREVLVTLECAGNSRTRMRPVPPGTPWDDGAVSTARYAGVALGDLLQGAVVERGAVEMLCRGADGGEPAFERAIPIEVAMHPDTILAYEMNGAPLPPEHGGPVRLIVPNWYGVASVKWIREIVALSAPFEGFYQKERYVYEDGSPVTRMRVKSAIAPPAGARVGERVRVVGRAWSGVGRIARVEVSTDAGATWADARMNVELGPYAWRGFEFDWAPQRPGPHTLLSRATDATGALQPLAPVWNPLGYGNNSCVPVVVDVAP